MKYRQLQACLPAVLCLIAARQVCADEMRCGNKLIMPGDSIAAVKALCGDPATVQQGVKESATTAVPAETWTYNRGPNQLLVNIRFVNGQVVAVETLHQYGY